MHLSSQIVLTNVICVLSFAYNLLSISKLLQDTSYQATFLDDVCLLQDAIREATIQLGKQEHGLYMLTATDQRSAMIKPVTGATSQTGVSATNHYHFNAQVSSINTWHAGLGHAPAQIIKMLPITSHNTIFDTCDSCYFAKQSRLSFSDSTHTSNQLFELVHADLWGPYRFNTHGNCNWFISLVEDKSSGYF